VFQAYRDGSGRYDEVIIDAEFQHNRCIWAHNCRYVEFNALKLTRAKREGMMLGVGGTGFDSFADPVDHITVRNCIAYNCSSANTYHGGFDVRAASSDILFERCEATDCGQGFTAGVPHHLVKSQLPKRITWRDCLARDNRRHGENSDGVALAGAHECLVSRMVAVGNVDDGINSQGPHCDDNVFEYCVAYNQNPDNDPDGDGNGFKINNINNAVLQTGLSGGANNIVRHCISFDNPSRGYDDTDGSQNTRYYNNIAYRNQSWGWILDSNAGQPGAGTTIGATLINNIAYGNRNFYDGVSSADSDMAASSTWNSVAFSDFNLVGDGRTPGIRLGEPTWDQDSIGGTIASPLDPMFVNVDPVVDIDLWVGDPAFRTPNPNFGRVTGLEFLSVSPCIDTGTDVGQDFNATDGDSNGSNLFDIGAYEFEQ
jgi:hypothetical protein